MRLAGLVLVLAACQYHAPGGAPSDADPDMAPPRDVDPPIDAPPGAWLDPWTHRKAITIHGTQVQAPAGGLTEFPVLVTLSGQDMVEIAAAAKADGSDLVVTRDDAMSELSIDVESYATDKLALWVKLPVLDGAADTRLYLYYGNPNVSASDPQEVWTHAYGAVWHLDQDPNPGTAGDIKDSSGNDHHGTAEATMLASDLIDGPAGKAIHFDGTNDFVDIPTAINLGNQFTISAWVNLSGGSSIKTVFSNSLSGLDKSGLRLFVDNQNQSDRMILLETSNGNASTHKTSTTQTMQITAGQWAHLAVVVDRPGGSAKIFVNGTDRTVGGAVVTDFQNNASFEIGRMGDIFTWAGGIDQFEIALEKRPVQWLQTSFTNQNDPPGFYQVDTEETPP